MHPDLTHDDREVLARFAAVLFDEGRTWPLRKLLTPGAGEYDDGAHTGRLVATPTRAGHGGYLAGTQTPDGISHHISNRLQYWFNLTWRKRGWARE